MKVENTRRVGTAAVAPSRPAAGTAPSGSATQAAPVHALGVAGIPEHELTPKVRVAIEMLMAEVQRLREELQQQQSRTAYLERLADEDSLVPVYNRRAFVRELSRMTSFAERYGTPSSLLYFDVNGMKTINDTHGHGVGDAALRHIGETLLAQVRESDVVGRLGGDEFGVILAQADGASAQEKASHLVSAIEGSPLKVGDLTPPMHAAYGLYTFTGGENVGEALERADKAMYARKQKLASG